ncbi:MAG: metal-dependent hydrolase [Firmicutes bacterium ML8_F2]|jgi:L-ascorbate metabolism protein UlaG (beta-lactamase superfamily)|nr:MAG: metal-dependent hydrolase [Firmicutes bacterium ML8_F2]
MPILTFLGHAAFRLRDKGKETLLFDPYITGNPQASMKLEEIGADYILVSHAHFDHLGDTYEIAKREEATIISTAEIAGQAGENGLAAHGQHLGGRHQFQFGTVKLTLAFHGSGIPGGHACGFVVDYYGKKIYFAGDTALFSDMKLIGELDSLDLALLPIGDNFTMGIDDAVMAASFLQAREVIPFHYNTWPLIEADPEEFKKKVEDKTGSKCIVLSPGEQHIF